ELGDVEGVKDVLRRDDHLVRTPELERELARLAIAGRILELPAPLLPADADLGGALGGGRVPDVAGEAGVEEEEDEDRRRDRPEQLELHEVAGRLGLHAGTSLVLPDEVQHEDRDEHG